MTRLKFYRAKWTGCGGNNPALVTWHHCAISIFRDTNRHGEPQGYNVCFHGNFTDHARDVPDIMRCIDRNTNLIEGRGDSRYPYKGKDSFFAHVQADLSNPVTHEDAESYLAAPFVIPSI